MFLSLIHNSGFMRDKWAGANKPLIPAGLHETGRGPGVVIPHVLRARCGWANPVPLASLVHRPGTGVPKTWESRKGRARCPDTEIYQEVDISKETPPTPKSSGQGGMFNLGSFFRRNSKKGSSRDLDPSLPATPSSQSATEVDPKLPRTPRPNLKELGEKRTSIKIVVDEDTSKLGEAEDVAKVMAKNAGEPGRSLTSTLSRKISMKRKEDTLSDIPEQVETHGPEVLVNEGRILVEGKPMDGRPTTEDGNVLGVAVDVETTPQTS